MTVEIVTPEKVLVSRDNVSKLNAPGICGDFGIWKNHASFVTMLGDGEISFETEEESEKCRVVVKDGFFSVIDNKIIILAEKGEIL
ncbi:MAG: F0F1 ATP synthase subunit epsilon [Armatimonadetes bacterium]|nr:F0F1 ATP synthase subunit epsilon [Candidatus Hippobium faecium]